MYDFSRQGGNWLTSGVFNFGGNQDFRYLIQKYFI